MNGSNFDIWVLAGQSNMQGMGERIEGLEPLERSAMLSFDRTWKPTVEPLHRFWETKDSAPYKMSPYLGFEVPRDELDRMYEEMHLQDAVEPIGGVGPGYFFAQELINTCGVPIGLIPCALGGSSLDMWMKTFAEEHNEAFEDTLYGDLIQRVHQAGGRVTGVLWYQGESDTVQELAKSYLERFERFVADLRRDLRNPDLPFITVQLGSAEEHDWAGEENWDAVREAQRLASEKIPHVEVIAAADLPRNDEVHISTAGQRVLGSRFAKAATKYTPGCKTSFSIPRLDRVSGADDVVEVEFSGVNGSVRSTNGSALSNSFTVSGNVVIDASVAPPNQVKLQLERPFSPDQELFYGRGFRPQLGLEDEAGFAPPSFGPVRATL